MDVNAKHEVKETKAVKETDKKTDSFFQLDILKGWTYILPLRLQVQHVTAVDSSSCWNKIDIRFLLEAKSLNNPPLVRGSGDVNWANSVEPRLPIHLRCGLVSTEELCAEIHIIFLLNLSKT